jgi:hypothetical protein
MPSLVEPLSLAAIWICSPRREDRKSHPDGVCQASAGTAPFAS